MYFFFSISKKIFLNPEKCNYDNTASKQIRLSKALLSSGGRTQRWPSRSKTQNCICSTKFITPPRFFGKNSESFWIASTGVLRSAVLNERTGNSVNIEVPSDRETVSSGTIIHLKHLSRKNVKLTMADRGCFRRTATAATTKSVYYLEPRSNNAANREFSILPVMITHRNHIFLRFSDDSDLLL